MVICFVVLRHYFFNKNPHFVTKFLMNIGFLFNILIINITYYSILCIRHLVSDPYCILHTVHCELVWVKKKVLEFHVLVKHIKILTSAHLISVYADDI